MTDQELMEQLADKEHASWARWMEYLLSKCEVVHHTNTQAPMPLVIPGELVAHWRRQINTPYSQLSEREKQADREEVEHILPIIRQYTEERDNAAWQEALSRRGAPSLLDRLSGVSEVSGEAGEAGADV